MLKGVILLLHFIFILGCASQKDKEQEQKLEKKPKTKVSEKKREKPEKKQESKAPEKKQEDKLVKKQQQKIDGLEKKLTALNENLKAILAQLKNNKSENSKQPWNKKEKKISKKIVKDFKDSEKEVKSNASFIGKDFSHLRFIDASGETLDLQSFVGKKNVLLVILRGFAGAVCIVCSSQTIALADMVEDFNKRNTQVILVYPGEVKTIENFLESTRNLQKSFDPPFPIVLDVELAIVEELSIQGSLAKPSSIILDKKGIVKYAYVGKNPGDRPNVSTLVKEIEKINTQ